VKKTGDEYFDSNEFRDLLAEYEKAVNTGQPVFMDADELAEIADFYQMTNRLDEAESTISLALSLSPGAIAPLTYRIHEALYQGDTQKAWQLLDQITETNEPDYIYNCAEILIAEGRIKEADTYFREEFRKVSPEEYQDFVVDVASIYSDYGYSEKAMEWMARAKQEDTPDFKELMARTLFGLGKYKDSEKLFNELIDTDPFQKRYWNALASAQFMNEDYSNAVQSSEYAIAIDPEDPEGLIAKANSLYRLNDYEQALDYYRRYLQYEANDVFAILHEGTCLINLGMNDEAIRRLEQGIVIAKAEMEDNDPIYLAELYEELAFAYNEKGEADKSLECLEKTDSLDCDHVQIEVIKGHVMLSAGRIEEAEEYFRNAVINSDNATQTLLRVIVSLYDNKYIEASYKMLQKFFRIAEKDNTEGYAYMALCCHDLKKYDEYLKYLKKACEQNPKECQTVLSHLFPEELAPEKYYEYLQSKMKQ
jgi:tetratricopeptide (TPR) repeat protein